MSDGFCECGCGKAASVATENRPALGHVKGQPTRYRKGHNNVVRRVVAYHEEDRGHDTPCWIWDGSYGHFGYGRVGVHGKRQPAHRFIYERERGPVSSDLDLDHLCRVVACVNPDHLEPVPHHINLQRGIRIRLDAEKVAYIRASSKTGPELAVELGVAPTTIWAARRGDTWKRS